MKNNNRKDAEKRRDYQAKRLIESCLLVCEDGRKHKAFVLAPDSTQSYIRNPDPDIPEDVSLEIHALSRKKQEEIGVTKVNGLEECFLFLETLLGMKKAS
jgi:hypothetical protein